MSTNISKNAMADRFVGTVKDTRKHVKEQRTNQTTWKGYLQLPIHASDPALTGTGEFGMYYNSGSGKIRVSYNGGAWGNYAP